ncbi:cell wall metabolism sensor histidine kinase WalK [Paenibacillus sp. YYML68]|uniref:sensor histidine kinase n=1 Tax=Paenibacillus sp. YYML68 TaxID=2909250 RepID=UPI00248FE623|nr:ATP-binding protein [Paenibacillus sp. YYML68]
MHTEDVSKYRAQGGVLVLDSYDWDRKHSLRLNGEWLFYWKQLWVPEVLQLEPEVERAVRYVELPSDWNGLNGPQDIPGRGYGTYRLTIKIAPDVDTLTLKMPYVRTAYKLWVNGELAAAVGEVGAFGNSKPHYSSKVIVVKPQFGTLDLIIQASNSHHRSGGMWDTPVLGSPERMQSELQLNLSIETIVVGGLLILGIHHLSLYAFRRKEKESVYFGIFCVLMGIRSLFLGESVIYYWFPGISWYVSNVLEYICYFIAVPSCLMFLYLVYPHEMKRWPVLVMSWLSVLSTLAVLLLSPPWFTYGMLLYEWAVKVAAVYVVAMMMVAHWRRREGTIFVLFGVGAYLTTLAAEMLYENDRLYAGGITFIGFLIGVLSVSFIVGSRFSKAITTVESLSRQMKELNAGLEQKIRERTAELERINLSLELVNEDLARMETSRRHLLSNISHDLGTPMTLIQGYVEALMDGVVDREQEQQYLKLIHNRITGLNRLIKDLFQLSKLEARQMEFDIQIVDTEELFQFFVERYELELAGAGIRFETSSYRLTPTEGRTTQVRVDMNRIDQVLTNIIYNAVKYTPKGGLIQLQFTVDEHALVVQVQDSGAGIAPEDLPYIFDRFYKKDKSRNTSGGGSGLGLAIAKEIIDYHGGRIWAQSRLGQGARLAFMLPLVK